MQPYIQIYKTHNTQQSHTNKHTHTRLLINNNTYISTYLHPYIYNYINNT